MNKLFPIVLALLFFGCSIQSNNSSIESNNGWTKELEIRHLDQVFNCEQNYTDDILVSSSCTKMEWVKCHQDFFKQEFSGEEFESILHLIRDWKPSETPIKSFDKRIAKTLKLVEDNCGESRTKTLLEEYINFYNHVIYLRDNMDISLKIMRINSGDVCDGLYSGLKDYQVRVTSYKNSEEFEPKVYSELLEVDKKVSELINEILNELQCKQGRVL